MLEYEAYCQEIAGGTLDHKEGVTASWKKGNLPSGKIIRIRHRNTDRHGIMFV